MAAAEEGRYQYIHGVRLCTAFLNGNGSQLICIDCEMRSVGASMN